MVLENRSPEKKIQELRDSGIVPVSPFACRMAGCAAFLGALALISSELINTIISLFNCDRLACLDKSYLYGEFLKYILIPLASYLVASIGVGLIQSKFFFDMSFRGARKDSILNRIFLAAKELMLVCIAVVAVTCIWIFFLSNKLMHWTDFSDSNSQKILIESYRALVFSGIGMATALGAIGYLIYIRVFLLTNKSHKVTR